MTIAVAGTTNHSVVRGACGESWRSAIASVLSTAASTISASNPYLCASDQRLLTHMNVLQPPASRLLPIREAFDRGASMDDAIADGIKSTAGVVTSAAIVMVAVFSIFATLSLLFFKQFGVGLAAAILIDATLVRAVLLPATMKLLGDRSWYLPGWLMWLPHVEPEEPSPAPEAKPTPVPA